MYELSNRYYIKLSMSLCQTFILDCVNFIMICIFFLKNFSEEVFFSKINVLIINFE